MVSVLAAVAISFSSIFATQQVDAYASVSGVSKISGLSNDFIRGVDISSLMALEQSGVTYRYKDGNKDDIANGEWYAEQVNKQGVNYDIFAASFYPMWDGTVTDMTKVLTNIAKKYNKKVMVAETAYPFTFNDSDGSANCINNRAAMRYANYSVDLKGQAYALYDVFNGISNVNKTLPGYGLGAFYWEPAWIKADSSTWGTNGSGWISSASGNYERMYTGKVEYFSTVDQGSSWDNMALFDKNGRAMKSLYVFDDIMGWNSKH